MGMEAFSRHRLGVPLWDMRKQAIRRITTCALIGMGVACGNDQTSRQEVSEDPTERQATLSSRTSIASPLLWVFLVDDAPTDHARSVRKTIADQIIGWLDQRRSESCVGADDVSVYWPVSLKVLIVPSSDPRDALHGGIVPDLDLHEANGTSDTAALWESTVASSIQNLESDTFGDNDLFSSAVYWHEVLRAERLPDREEDSRFLSTIDENTYVEVFVATSRDDSSRADFHPLDFGSPSPPEWRVQVSPSTDCSSPRELEFPHIAEWSTRIYCDEPLLQYGLACDFGLDCISEPPITLADGQAACRILAYADPSLTCPRELGWLDPKDIGGERKPLLAPDPANEHLGERRVCEIEQLSEQALRSCQTDIDCEDCVPGWCLRKPFTELSWDWRAQQCAHDAGWNLMQMRLVNGSNSAAAARLSIQCELDFE